MKKPKLLAVTRALVVALLFAKRDISSRYLGSLLGPLWVIISPLAASTITTIVFSVVFRHASEDVPYFLVVLSGLLSWGFFSASVSHATRTLVANRHIILSHTFPLSSAVIGSVVGRIADYGVILVFLLGSLALFGRWPSWQFLITVPLIVLLQGILQVGIGLLFATLNAYYRDVQNVVDVLLQLLFFATPILYPISAVPHPWRIGIQLHPVSLAVEATRAALLSSRFPGLELYLLSAWAFAALLVSTLIFTKLSRRLPDVI